MKPITFTAKLEKSPHRGGWTYCIWPQSGEFFGTHGLVKVKGRVEEHPFTGAFMAMGDGVHMLPIKAEIRKIIKKEAGDMVTVVIEERLEGKKN